MDEYQLPGGIENAGQVVRVGPHVLRPSSPYSASTHALLRAVRSAGFEGASLPVGIDDDGRERLMFVEGESALPLYPDWSQSDAALASIARLLRGLHDAAREFDAKSFTWDDSLADPVGGTIMCHNDVCLENVVFRDGLAVALLDFDFSAPGRPVFDVATLAKMCVPIDDDVNAARLGWRSSDRPARLRVVADAYGLGTAHRPELIPALVESMACGASYVRKCVQAGVPAYVRMWSAMGGEERFTRRLEWWEDNRESFVEALF
jgi:Phosphotransferase enzyme family